MTRFETSPEIHTEVRTDALPAMMPTADDTRAVHVPSVSGTGTRPPDERRNSGFTLIEIMAVVVIMGMLMATLAVGISGQIDRARINNTKTQITRIEQALEFYKLDNKRFPNEDQGLAALIKKPSAPPVPKNYNPAGYIKPEALVDPWDQEFQYRVPGTHNPYTFDLWSLGPDGVEGGDDIMNWQDSSDT